MVSIKGNILKNILISLLLVLAVEKNFYGLVCNSSVIHKMQNELVDPIAALSFALKDALVFMVVKFKVINEPVCPNWYRKRT